CSEAWRGLTEARANGNGRAAQEFVRLHGLAARALQFEDAHRALPAGDRELVIEHGAGRTSTFALGRAQRLDAQAFTRDLEPGARAGRQAGDGVMPLLPRPLPGDSGLVLCDFVRIGDTGLRLRRERERAALECAEGAHREVGAETSEPIVQIACGSIDGD